MISGKKKNIDDIGISMRNYIFMFPLMS